MLTTNAVFRRLHLAAPFELTEAALATELSTERGGQPVGAKELQSVLKGLQSHGYAASRLDDDNDTLWSLTSAGRAEARTRFC